jgi:hypothetical protein
MSQGYVYVISRVRPPDAASSPHAPHQISGVTASLPTEPVQIRKRAARACLEPELFDAISVPWYHLTCRLPSWTPVKLLEDSQVGATDECCQGESAIEKSWCSKKKASH